MYEMTRDEWWRFASEGTRTGMLGVARANGEPHVRARITKVLARAAIAD